VLLLTEWVTGPVSLHVSLSLSHCHLSVKGVKVLPLPPALRKLGPTQNHSDARSAAADYYHEQANTWREGGERWGQNQAQRSGSGQRDCRNVMSSHVKCKRLGTLLCSGRTTVRLDKAWCAATDPSRHPGCRRRQEVRYAGVKRIKASCGCQWTFVVRGGL
jgi:hypothetical protein